MERQQTTLFGVSLFLLLTVMLCIAGCSSQKSELSQVERGKYLTMAAGCGDCHTPKSLTPTGPVPDSKRLLSGFPANVKLPEVPKGIIGPAQWGAMASNDFTAWAGAWGISFSYNLTPHPATGIGNWTESLFIQSLRTGKFMGTSREMLPPMPWQQIGRMTDDDLKAIFAYLKSLPAVDNPIPPPIPPQAQ